MKQQINEIKRMQLLAGIISESQLNEAEETLPQYAKRIADEHNLILLNTSPDSTELYKMWQKEKGSFGNKEGVMSYEPSMKTVSVLSSDKKTGEAVMARFIADRGGTPSVDSKPFEEPGSKPAFFKQFLIAESQLNEAEEITPDQAIEKAMPLVSKIENSPALDKVAAEIAKDSSLMAQLEKALAKGGVQVNLNEAVGELDQNDMKTLMLNFAKKTTQLEERISSDPESDTSSVGLGMASIVVGGTIGAKMGGLIAAAIPAATSIFAGPAVVGALAGLALFLVARKIYLMKNPNK